MKRSVLTIVVFVLTQFAAAQKYNVLDLGLLQPVAINSTGEIAGNYNNHAYVRTATGRAIDLGLMPGGTFTLAAGINDLGSVVGTADGAPAKIFDASDPTKTATCTNLTQPFLWTVNKGMTTAPAIPVVAGIWLVDISKQLSCSHAIYANGLNNSGQVVASNIKSASTYLNGYLWNGTHGVSLVGASYQNSANTINDPGVIAGQSLVDNQSSHAYIWIGGVETDHTGLAAITRCSGANSINHSGTVAGWSAIDAAYVAACYGFGVNTLPIHGVLWTNGVIKDLGTLPGDIDSVAVRINSAGVVIGTSGSTMVTGPTFPYAPQIVGRPFVWTQARGMADLNEQIDSHLGWVLNTVADINTLGQIVGTGTHGGQTHGFLLTPQR